MISSPDFWDFVMEGGWDLLFPDDNENNKFTCPFCNLVISRGQKVQWIDKINKKFKCPECGKKFKKDGQA